MSETKPKKELITLYAWFSAIDQEGFKVKHEFRSKGETVQELLADLEFPKGVNRLVNVQVTRGASEIVKALAPHKARAILSNKSVFDFEQSFRGL